MNKQALLNITGHVQGVFYRAHAKEKADQLHLTGYAKNMPDGSVEALIQGSEENIKSFIDWAHEGSPKAKIDQIKISWQTAKDKFTDFIVL